MKCAEDHGGIRAVTKDVSGEGPSTECPKMPLAEIILSVIWSAAKVGIETPKTAASPANATRVLVTCMRELLGNSYLLPNAAILGNATHVCENEIKD